MSKQLLSHTRMSCNRTCPKQHHYRFELGLVPEQDPDYFRIGGCYHIGLECRNNGLDQDEATVNAVEQYNVKPSWIDTLNWEIEREKVRQLLAGYFWFYENDERLKCVVSELSFDLPLINPATGRSSKIWRLVGKIDGIFELDGRLVLWECKTCSEDIADGSAYWLRLRCDLQISIYMIAARSLGYDVQTVLYDVTRKPEIRPKQIYNLDNKGLKVVLGSDGQRVIKKDGKPKVSVDAKKGESFDRRLETVTEYGDRLLDQISERPDWYYRRQEIPRLDGDLDLMRAELWAQAGQIRDAQKNDRWFRNVGRWTCNNCDYAQICLQSVNVDPDGVVPAGFKFIDNKFPELERKAE